MVSTEVMLLVLAALTFPNLLYRATFNIPILLFLAIIWKHKTSLAAQLLVISWVIELYQLLDIVIANNRYVNPQKNWFLLTLTILVFILKVTFH